MKKFLKFAPSVFIIGEEYEITAATCARGLLSLSVGDETYYPENTGVLPSERTLHKIRVPQAALDGAREYTLIFRRSIERKRYFSVFGSEQRALFRFKPIEKRDGINIYHTADVHHRFEEALGLCSYFGEDTDLIVFNGDIGECDTRGSFTEVLRLVGKISGGSIPVLFVRGNHDARGTLAELYPEYFPTDGLRTYFTFKAGPLRGIALDCGEDKPDAHLEYNGTSAFEIYRRQELEFLRSLSGKYDFAVSHITPARATDERGSIFDIERELYSEWNGELSRLGVKFMLSGHTHEAGVLKRNDARSILPHDYAVIIGSAHPEKGPILGTALTLTGDTLSVKFTDPEGKIAHAKEISL